MIICKDFLYINFSRIVTRLTSIYAMRLNAIPLKTLSLIKLILLLNNSIVLSLNSLVVRVTKHNYHNKVIFVLIY